MNSNLQAPMPLRRFASRAALELALAERLARACGERASAIMLAGGTTPGPAYAMLGARGLKAAQDLRVLYSDERYVPSSSAASNFHLTQPLLAALALPSAQVLRVRTELALDEAVRDYEESLRRLGEARIRIGLGLLGLGADGHTASLFTSADLAASRAHLAIAVQRPDGRSAVSVTPEFLARIEEVVFVVAGADKAAALDRLQARDPQLTAWCAVADCAAVQIWADAQAAPP